MPPEIIATIVPTGGAISLAISGAVSGAVSLTRAVSGVAGFTTIFSGSVSSPLAFWLDIGDQLPGPLDPASLYQYQYTDNSGSVTTEFIQPQVALQVQQEPITEILIRLIQAGIKSLAIPSDIPNVQVTNAMPLGGDLPLPMIVVNLDIMQQGSIPIGQSTPPPEWLQRTTITTGFTRRVYRVSVLSPNAEARDFYRDNLVGIFEIIYGPVLQPLGIDVIHRWQVSSGQVAKDRVGMMPGFFFADIMMEFEGTLNVIVTPSSAFGLIETITFSDQNGLVAEVPVTS